jgi:hypothetical protein
LLSRSVAQWRLCRVAGHYWKNALPGSPCSKACASPELRERFRELAAEPVGMTPAEFASAMRADFDAVAKIAKAAGLKPE